ncbi:hypothetical protein GYMLUDRAFT_250975 [Collybiopsis luxurians FD-317 M1]|uniref:Uncharacterized protein n=1 Tax=Collybiopsis luxurians FD-317 M1 TaxID=944289 RepID=A0A0D0BSX4_9AGAR|nr:hypothetical protein GYMLUDRAFT_250975 [Collybiopsis luxurians FD-317 M1]
MHPLEETFKKEQDSDKLLLNWTSVKCTTEIQQALAPHKQLLIDLSLTPKSDLEFSHKFSPENIPALSYQPPKDYPSATPTFYCGGLLDTDLTGIWNWFYECLGSGDATELELHHLLDYSIAHAHTLLLTYCHFTEETAQFENVDSHVLHKAWEHLQEWNGLTVDGKLQQKDGVDVNFEEQAKQAAEEEQKWKKEEEQWKAEAEAKAEAKAKAEEERKAEAAQRAKEERKKKHEDAIKAEKEAQRKQREEAAASSTEAGPSTEPEKQRKKKKDKGKGKAKEVKEDKEEEKDEEELSQPRKKWRLEKSGMGGDPDNNGPRGRDNSDNKDDDEEGKPSDPKGSKAKKCQWCICTGKPCTLRPGGVACVECNTAKVLCSLVSGHRHQVKTEEEVPSEMVEVLEELKELRRESAEMWEEVWKMTEQQKRMNT